MAHITPCFSFTFLQEFLIATLLDIAGEGEEDVVAVGDEEDDHELWRGFEKQADILQGALNEQKRSPDFEAPGIYEPSPRRDASETPAGTKSAVQRQTLDGEIPNFEHLYARVQPLPSPQFPYVEQRMIDTAAFMWH